MFVCRFILHAKKTAFVVEHDFIMATYLADRVIVFDGIPSRSTAANTYVNPAHPFHTVSSTDLPSSMTSAVLICGGF